jgi:hypothetical protein
MPDSPLLRTQKQDVLVLVLLLMVIEPFKDVTYLYVTTHCVLVLLELRVDVEGLDTCAD